MSIYQYIRHPRSAQLEASTPVKTSDVAQDGFWNRLNSKVGLKVTLIVGTMWAAYLFLAISLFSAPAAFRSHDPIVIVSWISQSFLQLVLLPIIIVGQNIQGKAADRRAEETYQDALATLHEAKEIQVHLLAQDEILTNIIAGLQKTPRKTPVKKPTVTGAV